MHYHEGGEGQGGRGGCITYLVSNSSGVSIELYCKAPAKRSQHANTTYRNIVGRNMLRAFGHSVATCWEMLGVVGSNLTSFKLEPTTANISQHVATRWPNARNMLRPTMLRYVALACCDRLARA